MSVVAAPTDVTELIDDLVSPAVEEPDYIDSAKAAIGLLCAAWSRWSGAGLPTVQDADGSFRAALADGGDLSPSQVSGLAARLCPAPVDRLDAWLAEAAERLVLRIRSWMPIWVGFTWWVLESGTRRSHVVMLSSDSGLA